MRKNLNCSNKTCRERENKTREKERDRPVRKMVRTGPGRERDRTMREMVSPMMCAMSVFTPPWVER